MAPRRMVIALRVAFLLAGILSVSVVCRLMLQLPASADFALSVFAVLLFAYHFDR